MPGLGHLVLGRKRRGWAFFLVPFGLNVVPQRFAGRDLSDVVGPEHPGVLGLFGEVCYGFLLWQTRAAFLGARSEQAEAVEA